LPVAIRGRHPQNRWERLNFVPEESSVTGNQWEGERARLEERLNRLEQEVLKENRWWRGGLIAALVLLAFAILIGHHRHRPPRMPPMGMAQGEMPYGMLLPPRGPGYGWGGPCGGPGYGWGRRPWDGGPGRWNGPGPQVPAGPQDQSPQDQPAPPSH
jgi:hypothetical protein